VTVSFRTFFVCVLWCAATAAPTAATATTAGGTSITNTATATYVDQNNVSVAVVSNTITATVEAVSSVVTGPNEQGCNPKSDAVVTGQPFVRTFTITNASNIADSYTISASATPGSVSALAYLNNGSPTPFANGAQLPMTLAPGASVQVAVTANPGTTPVGSSVEVTLTAKSTATSSVNGQATSTAQQCAIVAAAATLGGPGGPGTAITKTVNGGSFAQAAPGSTLTYAVAFSNTGGVIANDVVLTDTVPANLTPDPSSVLVDGVAPLAGSVTLSGQVLTVHAASLAPGVPETVSFNALVNAQAVAGGSVVNVASVAADNAAAQSTTQAALLVGTGDIVYDGVGGSSQTVAGAVVTIVNAATKQPVSLDGLAFDPNANNANPFQTSAGGAYAFGLSPNQMGPTQYLLTVAAPGYINRQIQLTLTPSAGAFYSSTMTALDGQLLAQPGGFALVPGPVTLAKVYGLFGNIPLFRTQSVTITKTVDRSFAATGDRLVYTLTFANVGAALGATSVIDTLPPGLFYAPGTGRVDDIPAEPVKNGRVLTWSLPSLAATHTITYAAVIMPGTADNTILTNLATVSASAPNDPALKLSASSSVDTRITPGVFSDSAIITGRVFYDIRGTGYFTLGDAGVPHVRIYLEDGESVVTDPLGRYSFPAVKPGMHVLKLDRSTLPPDAHPYADASYDSARSTRRLVHGVFDGGLIQDVNFALAGAPKL
jgi:uncharacterized repeat protein (TIGR01451 family)